MRVSSLLLVGLLGLVATAPLSAQGLTGLPVHNSGITSGLTLGGEVGFPDADGGKGTAFGGRAAVGLGPLGVSALVSSWDPKGPGSKITSVGGYLNLKVFGGPLIPLSATLQGGAEYAKVSGLKTLHVPVGVGIALKIPNPALAIKPWIAPRLDYVRTTGNGINSNSETNFGISGGVEFSLLGGLGFGVSYDRTWVGNGINPSTFGVGANYTLKIPGL